VAKKVGNKELIVEKLKFLKLAEAYELDTF
jgi:hypothetical protein